MSRTVLRFSAPWPGPGQLRPPLPPAYGWSRSVIRVGGQHDGGRCCEFSGESTRWRQLGDTTADRLITRQPQVARPMMIPSPPSASTSGATVDLSATFPSSIVCRLPTGADGIGNIIGSMSKGDEASTQDLQVDEDLSTLFRAGLSVGPRSFRACSEVLGSLEQCCDLFLGACVGHILKSSQVFPRLLQRLLLVLYFVAAATLHRVRDLDPAYQNCCDDGRDESDSHGDEHAGPVRDRGRYS